MSDAPASRPTPRRRLTRLLALVTAGVAAAGLACTDPLSPEDLMGVYVLTDAKGVPVPTPWVRAFGGDWDVRIIAETLYLRPGRVGEQVMVNEHTENAGADTVRTRTVWAFEYDLAGREVRFLDQLDPLSPGGGRGGRTDLVGDGKILSQGHVYTYRGRIPNE